MPRLAAALTAVLAAALVLSSAAARQPVSSPIYYLSTAPEVRVGAPVVGELTAESGRNFKDGSHLDVLVLRGREGELVELRAASRAFDAVLTLYAPDGSVVAWNDDDPTGTGTDSVIRTTLPASGTYVIVVSGYGPADLGDYTVTLEEPRALPAPPETQLTVPSSVQGTLVEGTQDTYLLTIHEPTVVGIEVRSSWFDTYLEVRDGDGWTMAENDDMLGTTDSGVVVWLDVGTYEVLVSAYGSWGNGPYTLTLDRYVRTP
jgi:hypothetical protein